MFEKLDDESSVDFKEDENLGLVAITESLFSSSKDEDPKKDSSLDVLSFEFNNMSSISEYMPSLESFECYNNQSNEDDNINKLVELMNEREQKNPLISFSV